MFETMVGCHSVGTCSNVISSRTARAQLDALRRRQHALAGLDAREQPVALDDLLRRSRGS